MKILFVITTYNQSKYTEICLDSLLNIHNINFDILIIDDCSSDDTRSLCNDYNLDFIEKETPMGLTHSWNLGYINFKKKDYDILVLSNNDIILPENSLNEIIEISNQSPLICPLSIEKGIGNRKLQSVHEYYSFSSDFVNNPSNFQLVQNNILELNEQRFNKLPPIRMNKFSGFFFVMNRNIIMHEFSSEQLFDPSNVNVGNEDELNSKLLNKGLYALLCKTSFVFHFKGVSFAGDLGNERDDLTRYH